MNFQKQIRRIFTLALAALAIPAYSQYATDVSQVAKSLPPQAQTVIARLASFDTLPARQWRYHPGDLAHGEAPTLDDTSWPVIEPGHKGTTDASWYRRTIEVPKTLNGYDLAGSRIWFQFNARANGPMPAIVYFNGRRVALGDDLEPIILFDPVKPGDKILVAVKLLHTVDAKTFTEANLKIDFAPNRPNPSDLRLEFLSSAALIPSLSHDIPHDTETLEHAITAVDLTALDKADQARFDMSLAQATTFLQPLKPVLAQATLHLTGNSHIDAAWLWPVTETVDVVKRTFSTALQLMNEYPDYTYTQSAAAYNDWIAQKYPQMNDEIRQRIKEGRWEIVGGMWVEPDLNMPDGETQVRSLLIGKRFFQQQYGVDVRIGWNPDSFGYNWQLPQIYKRSGMDYFVTQKMKWNDTNQLPFKLFWWQSPDGSKVLTYFPHDYANKNLNPLRLTVDLADARKLAPGLDEMMDLYGVGDHGGGPTRAILDEGDHWAEPDKVMPKVQFGLAQPFFSSIEKQIAPESTTWNYASIAKGYKTPTPVPGKISIPTWNSEMYFEYHRGVMTTQANHKRNMRESEEQTLNAEKYASLAWLDGNPYPGEILTDAWKKIAFNTFHDLAAGSGIGIIYKEAQEDYDKVRLETSEISTTALNTIASRIDTKSAGDTPILIFNPLAWAHSGNTTVTVQLPAAPAGGLSVLDAHNNVVPSAIVASDPKTNTYQLLIQANDVPSLGYKVLHVIPAIAQNFGVNKTKSGLTGVPLTTDLKATATTLENASVRVVIDPATGCITSLYDKKSNFETLAKGACGNQLQTFADNPERYDAWNIDPGTLDHMTPITAVDSVTLTENTPLRASIRVTRTWQSSHFSQDIVLYANSPTIDVHNDIDWHETHVLLKAAFPLAATAPLASYEIPYGNIARPTTRNNTWEQAQFEVPALRWADLGDNAHGFSILNTAKYGYDAAGNTLRLTLLRSPIWPDPDADRGRQRFSYALYPHAGPWQQALTEHLGYEHNYPFRSLQLQPHTGALPLEHSFATVTPSNVVLTAIKKAEDSNSLIFRVFEWAGKSTPLTFTVPPGATSAHETNLMEKPVGSPLPVTANHVTIPIHPYEILTLRVDYH